MKSVHDYVAEIQTLHSEIISLQPDIPYYEFQTTKLSRRLSAWAQRLSITVHVASNEQTPWTKEELGYTCIPMELKKSSGARQVGDYVVYLDDYDMFAGLVVERKGVTRKNGHMISCDLYSTLSNSDGRRRFEAEYKRYIDDTRFNRFVLIAECSYAEYLDFKPTFNGKLYNKSNFGMSVPARRATIAKLEAMGCSVFFAGTRKRATDFYHDLVLQWCRANYIKILPLSG